MALPPVPTEKEAKAHFEDMFFAQHAAPVLVALKHFTDFIDEEYSDPAEMPEWLLAKALYKYLLPSVESMTTTEEREALEEEAEAHFEAYRWATAENLPLWPEGKQLDDQAEPESPAE